MDSAETIEVQAAQWLTRREARALEPHEEEAFEAWCDGDERRLGAYVRIEAITARMDRAAAFSGLSAGEPSLLPRRVWIPTAIAATVVLSIWPATQLMRPPVETRSIATEVGEQRRSALADGSLVELNTDSQASVTLKPTEREVRLSAGEAVFQVAKDRKRPFIVKTAFGDVRAVGTVFSVRLDVGLEVAVSEGVVEIERHGRVVARVAAGETFHLDAVGDAVRKGGQAQAIERSMAWREGKVAFAGETLAEAAAELNRYNTVKIHVADPAVAGLRFGGLYRATDPEGFTEALSETLPVQATKTGDVITLARR